MAFQKPAWDLIDETAIEIGVTEENLRKWHERGGVPPKWHASIVRGFQKRGFLVELDFFDSLPPAPTYIRPTARAASG